MIVPFTRPTRDGVRVGRALILGPAGSGKTTLGIALAPWLAPKRYMVVVGPVPTIATKLGVTWHNLSTTDRDAQEAFFLGVLNRAKLPYDEGGADVLLIVDEADMYFSSAGRTYGSKALQEIVNTGRNFGLSQVLIARGTSDLAKNAISNSSVIFMARTVEPNLLDYARRYMRDVPDVERVISNLPPHVFLVYAPNASPKLLGFVKVVGGEIVCRDLPSKVPQSKSYGESTEPDSLAEPADTPGAEKSYAPPIGPISAATTTQSTSANSIA